MEIDEVAARLLRQYWGLIALCIALPVAAITLITIRQPPMYAADARIITGSVVPQSSSESDAIVSQVLGIATSRSAASKALAKASAHRNLTRFIADDISVSGLGTSQVVDLTITDHNRHVAERVASVLASEVTKSLNNVGQSGLYETLKAIDDQVVALSQQRVTLAAQAAKDPSNQPLQAKLAGLDEVIANLTGDRGRLIDQASSQGIASVIDSAALPAHAQSSGLPQKLGLAVVLGIVAGILFASIVETVRPTVPGARRVGRRLGAPLLGRLERADVLGERTPAIEQLVLRLRLAARHAEVSAAALTFVGADDQGLGGLAATLQRALPAGSPADWVGPDGVRRTSGVPVAAGMAANSHHRGPVPVELVATGRSRVSALVDNNHPEGGQPALRNIYTLGQVDHASETGGVGLLIVCGPVARVADVSALADLAASSGWPLLGVVAVPRIRHSGRSGRYGEPGRATGASAAATGSGPAGRRGGAQSGPAGGWD